MFDVTINIKGSRSNSVTFSISSVQAADPVQLYTVINQYLSVLNAQVI